jgi:hypothetical protein
MHYQLMKHTFPTFQHLIDRAIMTEKKRKEMEDRKRKIGGPQPGSSNRPVSQATRLTSSSRISARLSSSFRGSTPQHQQQNRQNIQTGGSQFQRQNQQAPHLPALASNQSSQAAPVQGGGRACFHCESKAIG